MVNPPGSRAILDRRVQEFADQRNLSAGELRVTIGQLVVAQLLPGGLVKGGAGLRFRLGHLRSRASSDLDIAWREDHKEFAAAFAANLQAGWGPFDGRLLSNPLRPIEGIPAAYAMRPYDAKLSCYNKPFGTVTIEVGYDELDATGDGSSTSELAVDVLELFSYCGLPEPAPVPLIALHHQIAQKLHALTEPGSERAHDLVDLQLLWSSLSRASGKALAETVQRLFAFRAAHQLSPILDAGANWETLYLEAAAGLEVAQELSAAIAWLNERLSELGDVDTSDAG